MSKSFSPNRRSNHSQRSDSLNERRGGDYQCFLAIRPGEGGGSCSVWPSPHRMRGRRLQENEGIIMTTCGVR